MLTRQEIFNLAWNGLKNQNWEQCKDPSAKSCSYRYNGMKCAFGHLIPDDVYFYGLEGASASGLINYARYEIATGKLEKLILNYPKEIEKFSDWIRNNISYNDKDFIHLLQADHDDEKENLIRERFVNFAKLFELEIPE